MSLIREGVCDSRGVLVCLERATSSSTLYFGIRDRIMMYGSCRDVRWFVLVCTLISSLVAQCEVHLIEDRLRADNLSARQNLASLLVFPRGIALHLF